MRFWGLRLKGWNAAVLLAAIVAILPRAARADEGMWTLDNLPLRDLQERYAFTPDPVWLEHVRLACVRFNDGGSGAFVSSRGLVLTNHHVGSGQLQKMSSETKDYVRDGFYARTLAEEIRCPDLELNQLISMEDVSARVLGAIQADAPAEEQNRQRKAAIARIEKESMKKTGLRSDVVQLYEGGEYWLYRYRKYTDVRLVMAPEEQAAFFGGDLDNFTFPRHDLDMTFFRVYENGQPVHASHYFRWSKSGAQDGELVFVLGHPGSTLRLHTMSQLEYTRDYELPTAMKRQDVRRKAYREFSARGPEEARRAAEPLDGVENSHKNDVGGLAGLRDPLLWARLVEREQAFRAQVSQRPELARACGDAWDRIAAAMREMTRRHKEWSYRQSFRASKLADMANTIVRYVAEVAKPNEKRYEEFQDSALESLNYKLFSRAPIYRDLDEFMLAVILQEDLDELGPDDPGVRAALGGRTPREMAHELISGTRLDDPAVRQALIRGGPKAVERSKDPLIVWARGLDGPYRELRAWQEDKIESVLLREGNRIAGARFALYGKSQYPDATFTLRLSYGKVAGYELGTTRVPYKTTFFGLFDRAASFDNQEPFQLSPREEKARGKVNLDVPLDFVTTNDIIGGNSGSPVLNRDAEYVGLIFDGNIQGLVLDYLYTEEQARAVAVHSSGILEALRNIYQMDGLVQELTAP